MEEEGEVAISKLFRLPQLETQVSSPAPFSYIILSATQTNFHLHENISFFSISQSKVSKILLRKFVEGSLEYRVECRWNLLCGTET